MPTEQGTRLDLLANPLAGSWAASAPDPAVTAFHRRLPGYRPTPLLDLPALASPLGLGHVLVKDESDRLGLPAFKMLGASWATYRSLVHHLGQEPTWATLDELAAALEPVRPLDLATATDGNHGRAVARMARLLGLGARIFVPEGTSAARIDAIVGEGATCEVVAGTYDDAVARAAEEAGPRCLVVSDTSWDGYEVVPAWVIEGYATIFRELDAQLAAAGLPAPDVVLVPMGVGALGAATAAWYRHDGADRVPRLVGVEPDTAACVMASARAGRRVEVPGPHRSIMAGLNCGWPSDVAWPAVAAGFDWFTAIDDGVAVAGMRALADVGVVAGETGAAGLGALAELCARPGLDREPLGIGPGATALVIVTEGATDPAAYLDLVGRTPEEVARRAPACAAPHPAASGTMGCAVTSCPQPCRPAGPDT